MTTRSRSNKKPKTEYNWGCVIRRHKELQPHLPPLGFTGPKKKWHYFVTLACATGNASERVERKISVSKGLYEILQRGYDLPICFELINGKPENVRLAQ